MKNGIYLRREKTSVEKDNPHRDTLHMIEITRQLCPRILVVPQILHIPSSRSLQDY